MEEVIELNEILKIIKKRKWIIINITLLFILIGIIISFVPKMTANEEEKDLYKSTASIVIVPFSDLENSNIKDTSALNQQILKTYVAVAYSTIVAEETIVELNLDIKTNDFKDRLKVITNPNTQLIMMHYVDEKDGNQQEILNSYVKNFIQEAQDKYPAGKLKILDEPSKVEMITQDDFLALIDSEKQDSTNVKSGANAASSGISQNMKLILVIAMFLGMMAGTGISFLIEVMDNTIKKKQEAEEIFKSSTLSIIPYDKLIESERVKEAFRILRANLQLKKDKVFTITSASKEDGKTLVSMNLARTFAEAKFRTLIIDGNGRNSKLSEMFNLKNNDGISDILNNMVVSKEEMKQERDSLTNEIDSALLKTDNENLNVLTWGNEKINSSDLLSKSNIEELLQELRGRFDYIIIDTTAMVSYCDAQFFSKSSDGTLVVLAEGKTDKDEVLRMKELIDIANIQMRGLVWRKGKF